MTNQTTRPNAPPLREPAPVYARGHVRCASHDERQRAQGSRHESLKRGPLLKLIYYNTHLSSICSKNEHHTHKPLGQKGEACAAGKRERCASRGRGARPSRCRGRCNYRCYSCCRRRRDGASARSRYGPPAAEAFTSCAGWFLRRRPRSQPGSGVSGREHSRRLGASKWFLRRR